jgi:hypothetical protein
MWERWLEYYFQFVVFSSATGQQVPLVFLVPRANTELVCETHVALHAASATFPNINLKSFVKKLSSKSDQNS